jgi:hypothetical protein
MRESYREAFVFQSPAIRLLDSAGRRSGLPTGIKVRKRATRTMLLDLRNAIFSAASNQGKESGASRWRPKNRSALNVIATEPSRPCEARTGGGGQILVRSAGAEVRTPLRMTKIQVYEHAGGAHRRLQCRIPLAKEASSFPTACRINRGRVPARGARFLEAQLQE